MTIEKNAKIVPVTVTIGPKLSILVKFPKSKIFKKAWTVNLTSLNKIEKKKYYHSKINRYC